MIKNPNRTTVKLLLLSYNYADMPVGTKTFLRQKVYYREKLRYAVHISFHHTTQKRLVVQSGIRVVFAAKCPESDEPHRCVQEGPEDPKYIPLDCKKDEWVDIAWEAVGDQEHGR